MNEDPAAILSPIIDPDIPSHKLVIVSTTHYRKFANNIISLAKRRGYSAEHKLLPDSYYTEDLKDAFYKIFNELDYFENEVWLNATNGHRIQSLCAFEIARDFDIPTYVVNSTNDSLYWVHPAKRESIKIQDKLKLNEYVELYKSTLISHVNGAPISEKRKAIGRNWVKQATKRFKALTNLNFLASTCSGSEFLSPVMNSSQIADLELQQLLEELQSLDLIEIRGKQVSFLNDENRFFCNGGWLEEYTYAIVQEIARDLKSVQDVAHSAVLQRNYGSKYVKNEIDVAALVNNKLHIIECKTNKLVESKGVNIIYKLDSINDVVGGIRGRAALISYYPLSEGEQLRAHELSIRVFHSEQLVNLKHHLKTWFSEA